MQELVINSYCGNCMTVKVFEQMQKDVSYCFNM